MKTLETSEARISDADLIAEVKRLAADERAATTELLRSLMEFDARRLYLGEGYPSLFCVGTQVLHYAEHAALNRIEVARAARRLPVLLDQVAEGALHITGARQGAVDHHARDQGQTPPGPKTSCTSQFRMVTPARSSTGL